MYDCIAIGEILVDFIADQKNEQGFPILNGNPGGGPPNFIVACQKLGLKTALIGKVGADMFGELLISAIGGYGVDVASVAVDDAYFTTLAFVSLEANGERSFSFARQHSADLMLSIDNLPNVKLKQTRALHFSSLSLVAEPAYTATLRAIELARSGGAIVHFDPNYRPPLWPSAAVARQRIKEALAYCDILKISESELAFLLKKADLDTDSVIEQAAKQLFKEQPQLKLLHVTRGATGVFAMTAQQQIFYPAYSKRAIDTTGAGDAYGAAALTKLLTLNKGFALNEHDLRQIVDFASVAAGLSVMRYGGIPSSASLDEVLAETAR